MPAQMVRIERTGMPKKSAHFLHFLAISYHFLTISFIFLHFFALFFLPILPIRPIPTPQSLFLARKQGFTLKSPKISPQNPSNFKKLSQKSRIYTPAHLIDFSPN